MMSKGVPLQVNAGPQHRCWGSISKIEEAQVEAEIMLAAHNFLRVNPEIAGQYVRWRMLNGLNKDCPASYPETRCGLKGY